MNDHLDQIDPVDAGLMRTTEGVLLIRCLRERRAALDRVAALEAAGLDEERLARALHPIVDEQIADDEWGQPGRTYREMAAAIAKAYREDTDATD